MAARRLKNWLKSYLEYTSPLEAPDEFHFWVGVSTIAGALRRQVYVDMVHFQWTPNFYIILVGPPGLVTKSTSVGIGSKLLRQLPDVTFGPNSFTWQALVQSLSEGTTAIEMPGGIYQQMSCITCVVRELGTMLDMRDQKLVDVLTDLWDGQLESWKKATMMNGTETIENPWINIIAATTPGWIMDNISESAVGGGFTSRCVFVYGDKKRHYMALPKYHMPDMHETLWADLVHDLERIAMLRGEFNFSKDAVEYEEAWYKAHWENFSTIVGHDRLVGHISRKQTHRIKLAMVLSVARNDSLILTKQDLEEATHIVTALEAYHSEVFSHIGQSDTGKLTQLLVDAVRRAGAIERSALLRLLIRNMDEKTFATALNTAISAQFVSMVQRGNKLIVVDTTSKLEIPHGQQPNA